jgi:hypothetical protein
VTLPSPYGRATEEHGHWGHVRATPPPVPKLKEAGNSSGLIVRTVLLYTGPLCTAAGMMLNMSCFNLHCGSDAPSRLPGHVSHVVLRHTVHSPM